MGKELVDWAYEQKCKKAVGALEKNGFTAVYCQTKEEAFDYIIKEAEGANTVGFGQSVSLKSMKIAEKLEEIGKEVLIHIKPGLSMDEVFAIARRQLTSDLFLSSTNALTLSGYLVNIDATGNRVSSMIFGPKKVIVLAGRNKIVEDTEEAIKRIKRQAAPPNAKRLDYNVPCAKTGFCHDCDSPARICRITTVIERKPRLSNIHVLVVNEDLGL